MYMYIYELHLSLQVYAVCKTHEMKHRSTQMDDKKVSTENSSRDKKSCKQNRVWHCQCMQHRFSEVVRIAEVSRGHVYRMCWSLEWEFSLLSRGVLPWSGVRPVWIESTESSFKDGVSDAARRSDSLRPLRWPTFDSSMSAAASSSSSSMWCTSKAT